jgi:tartrate dehydratase beta subunit/fumarate hydratase class I family protein
MGEPTGVEEIMRALDDARSELAAREQAVTTETASLNAAHDVAKAIMKKARMDALAKTRPVEESLRHTETAALIAAARVKRLEEMLYVALEEIKGRIDPS